MDIFGVGLPEILLIAVVAIIILGPDRLPATARSIGKGVADFRRALEPAREAWSDVTREINDVVQGNTPTLTTKGEAITGNPWKVHPLAEGLSDEERDAYFKTGELPAWKLAEIDKNSVYPNGNKAADPNETLELDYPEPNAELASRPAVEELYYPEPTHKKAEEETGK